ncbi:MAG: hypothetical protein HFJ51_05090 [Clostridia bacterium]|nr:hypothetical protein [Clostridia bacterium]
MCCCDKKCNVFYAIISISLTIILLIWNFTLTIVEANNNPAHINSFNYAPEKLQEGAYITFDTNRVVEKNDIIHQEGASDFIINQTGNYLIQFNTTIYEPPSTGKETTLSVYLEHNNATVYGTTVGETVSNAYQTVDLSFSVIIKANSGDILRIKNNSGTIVELLQPNIDIIRIK